MLRIGIRGDIQHGKNALADALCAVDSERSVSTESSTVIIRAANVMNDSLTTFIRTPLCDAVDVVKSWVDNSLPEGIHEATPLEFDASRLCLSTDDFIRNPGSYKTLCDHLEMANFNPSMLDQEITNENKETFRPLLQWIGGYVTNRLGRSLWYEEIVRHSNDAETDGNNLFVASGVRFLKDVSVWRAAGGIIVDIDRPDKPRRDKKDPTEIEGKLIVPDFKVLNNGSLEQLGRLAAQILKDLPAGRPREIYIARAF